MLSPSKAHLNDPPPSTTRTRPSPFSSRAWRVIDIIKLSGYTAYCFIQFIQFRTLYSVYPLLATHKATERKAVCALLHWCGRPPASLLMSLNITGKVPMITICLSGQIWLAQIIVMRHHHQDEESCMRGNLCQNNIITANVHRSNPTLRTRGLFSKHFTVAACPLNLMCPP